jgi:hypothetical protein
MFESSLRTLCACSSTISTSKFDHSKLRVFASQIVHAIHPSRVRSLGDGQTVWTLSYRHSPKIVAAESSGPGDRQICSETVEEALMQTLPRPGHQGELFRYFTMTSNGNKPSLTPAKLAHIVLRTNKIEALRDFYLSFLGARLAFEEPNVMVLIRYDEEHHRIGIIGMPDIADKVKASSGLEVS